MATYERAQKSVLEQVNRVMHRYHGPKEEAGVTVNVLMALPTVDGEEEPTGPAITVNGYKALAKIKILGLKDRVAYGFDAEMVLDADNWELCSDEQQNAIIDHELSHLELMVDDDGGIKRDDADRPRLRMRKHDYHFGWFADVAHRHGENSLEVRQAREMLDGETWHQCFLPGMEPVEA